MKPTTPYELTLNFISVAESYTPYKVDYSGPMSSRPSTPSFRPDRSSESLGAAVTEIDLFGLRPNDNDDLLPIVDVWLDLGAQFMQHEIPDPMDFIRSYDALVR